MYNKKVQTLTNYSQQTFPLSRNVKLYRPYLLDDRVLQIYALDDGRLQSYQYHDSNWQALSVVHLDTPHHSSANILWIGQDILIVKTYKGINFYQYKNGIFDLLSKSSDFEENEFHDVYDWNKPGNVIKCGHFYYGKDLIGILTKHQKYGVKLYAVMKDALFSGEYPIWPLNTDLSIFDNSSEADFFLADLKEIGRENIVVCDKKGLNIYELNQYNNIQHVMQVPNSEKLDDSDNNLFFANITSESYKDIVVVNSSGLFVYQFNNEKNNYQFIYYNPMFSKANGWNLEHISSFQFEDLNLDGKQEMIFTGPRGISSLSYNNYTNQWQFLLDNSKLTIPERHSKVIKVIPPSHSTTKYPMIFLHYKNQLGWAFIYENKEFDKEENVIEATNETMPQLIPSIIPQVLNLVHDEERPTLLLRDKLDCSSIIDAVDKNTGKPHFMLPLIDLSNRPFDIKLDLYYDGNNMLSEELGFGWSMPQNLIFMDHQSSIFPEDEKYYIILNGVVHQLIYDIKNTTENTYSFKLSNDQPDLQIYYQKSKEKWEINSKLFKQVYGRTEGVDVEPINWELTWKNWRGIGRNSSGQQQLATAWYLAEVRDKLDNVMSYTYKVTNVAVPNGKSFTREIYLKSINDKQGITINFKYSHKDVSEYNLLPLVDQEGILNTQVIKTLYLESYTVITQSYRQDINFVYKVEEGKRFLTNIKQKGDITNQPILQFTYREIAKSYVLENVVLPTGINVEFSYKLIEKSPSNKEIGQRYRVKKNYRVDYGNEDILISYINQHQKLELQIFNQEMTEVLYSASNLASSESGLVKKIDIIRGKDILGIILYYHTDRELCLLCKDDGIWLPDFKCYKFLMDPIIYAGKDFVVVENINTSVDVISWNKNSKSWNNETLIFNKEIILLTTFSRGFIYYDNDFLSIVYKTWTDQWQHNKIISIPGVITNMKATLDKFKLTTELYNMLFRYFKHNALQMSNNLLILNRWEVEEAKLFSIIDFFVLDDGYKLVQHQKHNVFQVNLNQFTYKFNDEKGNFFTLGYKEADKKIDVIVKELRGPFLDGIVKETNNGNINEARRIASEIFIKSVGTLFLLDHRKYFPILNLQTVKCSNMTFTFLSDIWKVHTVSNATITEKENFFPLGDRFILHKENLQSSLKLYKRGNHNDILGNCLLDLEIKDINSVLNLYPVYLVYQEKNKQVGVVEFSNDGNISEIYKLPQGENVSPWSSIQMLVTSLSNSDSDQYNILVFRPQLGIRRLLPNSVIAKVTLTLDNYNKRITAYEYSSARVLGNKIFYEKFSIIPGNDKASFGWIDELRNKYNVSILEKKVHNSQGHLVKSLKLQLKQNTTTRNSENTVEENLYLNTTLFDKSDKLKIAQFSPFKIADEEVGYYGFEDYEINKIGTRNSAFEKRWLFNRTDIVKQKFSFTGQNHLTLFEEMGSALEGTFQPHNQYQDYVASCWMRPHKELLELNTVTPYLKAIIKTDNNEKIFRVLGEVKFQSGDWFYLEVYIDIFFAKEIFKKSYNLQSNSSISEESNVNLQISILITPGVNVSVDVDNVRFFPSNCNFQANVYDLKTNKIREVIHSNGLVEKFIYDKYEEKVASINQYGQLEEFNTYTKASSISRVTRLKNRIKINPDSGFFENFSPYSFYSRWRIDNANSWRISPGHLQHLTNDSHNLRLSPNNIDTTFYGLRLCFVLKSENCILKFNNDLKISLLNQRANIVFLGNHQPIPEDGEILIIVEGSRVFVWVDGGLYIDGSSNNSILNIEITGNVKISDVMVFSRPSIQATYLNNLGENLQNVILVDENTVIVSENLYDELGRQSITTEPAYLKRSNSQSLLTYYSTFVTNKNPYSNNSVWKTGRLQGDASMTFGEYNYSQIKYCNDPRHEKCAIGLPGKEFHVSGPYAKIFTSSSKNIFIKNLFPKSQNYSYQVEKSGSRESISVFDNNNNRVALYVHVIGSKDLLSTYEFDENDRLVKSLPPLYHERVRTFQKSYSQMQFLSEEEKALQKSLATQISYDRKGNIITKTVPDSEEIENIYDKEGLLKFVVQYSKRNIDNVIYFTYDHLGRIISTGKLTSFPTKENLLTLVLSGNNTEEYQQFYHSDFEREPILRGRLKRTITFNNDEPFIEESILNIDQNTLSKRIIIPSNDNQTPLLIVINKRYVAKKLKEIEYPIDIHGQSFRLIYQFNKIGQIIGVGIPGKKKFFASFTYNAGGQVSREQHLPESVNSFSRQYSYNSPGFLTILEDKFLREKVYYTDGSYAGQGYGDGSVSRTEFKAYWHEYCDNSKLGLNEHSFISKSITFEESKLCFRKLKNTGYLNEMNHQAKVYYPALEPKFPIVCSYGIKGRQIQSNLGEKGFPKVYGHSYDYSNYQELNKAKYYVGNELPLSLQPDTFAIKIDGINSTTSHDIWKILQSSGYLVENNDKAGLFLGYGKKGKSFIRSTLFDDLKNVNPEYVRYELPLERILGTYFSYELDSSVLKLNFKDAFTQWNGGFETERLKQSTNEILDMLEKKHYLDNPLADEFKITLKQYQTYIPAIVHVLIEHFAKQLGEAEYDVESYSIDANGNHKHFYTGFDRYELNYRNNTNQITNIKLKSYISSELEHIFSVKHDSKGNIIQALHKGIHNIDYHSVSNRATKIQLINGQTLSFYYDAQGERVLKRVTNSQSQITKEIHYIRDEFGRALVEREFIYISQDLPPKLLITAYIYGPRGLFGFIRRDEFYSIITDHEGSIRLVVKNGEVVAAYDYLPYGSLMRAYGNNPEAHISYRYTGQEWDEELELYNFHARFYDPNIGRFYQIDPKNQYFSPYKYAGNSPISIIDPDGELAVLAAAIVFGGVFGAYLGGAAMNDNWNFVKWDYKSAKTYVGILSGTISGALIPVGFGASIGTLTAIGVPSAMAPIITISLGGGGMYAGMAATNNKWDPSKWNFTSPRTWNSAFDGFGMGSGVIGGANSVKAFYKSLSTTLSKVLFIAGSTGFGGGLFVYHGHNAYWDFSKPAVYFEFVNAVTGAFDIPMYLHGVTKFLGKNGRNVIKGLTTSTHVLRERSVLNKIRNLQSREALDSICAAVYAGFAHSNYESAKSLGKMFGGTAITSASAYLMGSAVSEGNWDMTSPSTYFAIINGILNAGQLSSLGYLTYRKRHTLQQVETYKVARRTADENIRLYKNLLYNNKISYDQASKQKFSYRVITDLQKNKIPHSAVSVVIDSDKNVFTAFSGNAGPGVLVFDNLKTKSKSFIISDDNAHIGGRKVALSDDREINNAIENALKNKKNDIIKNNIDEFKNEKNNIKNLLQEKLPLLPEKTIDDMITKFQENIIEKGYINEEEISSIMKAPVSKIKTKLQELNNQIKPLDKIKSPQKKEEKIIDIKNNIIDLEAQTKLWEDRIQTMKKNLDQMKQKIALEDDKVKSLYNEIDNIAPNNEEAINAYENKLTLLESKTMSLDERIRAIKENHNNWQRIKKDFDKIFNQLSESMKPSTSSSTADTSIIGTIYEKHLKIYNKFTHWEPTNCGEPHVINTALRRSQVFPSFLQNVADFTLKDIRYLATFKIEYSLPSAEFTLEYMPDLPYTPLHESQGTHFHDLRKESGLDLVTPPHIFPILIPFERCDHCAITTNMIRNVITDPVWFKKIEDLMMDISDLNTKQDLAKERLYFLLPYNDMTNRLIYNATDDDSSTFFRRQKRSEMIVQTKKLVTSNSNEQNKMYKREIANLVTNNNIIDINQQFTNSAARSFSYVNDFFNWMRSSMSRLFSSNSTLSKLPLQNQNTTSSILPIDTIIDVNATIMLLDLLIRNVTGQKYISSADHQLSLLEAQGYALTIIDEFEKIVEETALKCGISMHYFNIDYINVQKIITGKIMSGKCNEISRILNTHIDYAYLEKNVSKLRQKRFDHFKIEFLQLINKLLNQST